MRGFPFVSSFANSDIWQFLFYTWKKKEKLVDFVLTDKAFTVGRAVKTLNASFITPTSPQQFVS
jgi:hypothetical protein